MPQTIATFASHSSLQIMHGAKKEGFQTLLICKNKNAEFYQQYSFVDKIVQIERYEDFLEIQHQLPDCIIIPHGSFVSYVGAQNMEKLKVPHYGNRHILKWESDRALCREWLEGAGLLMPKTIENAKAISQLCIVKFDGARGGQGYFLCKNPIEFSQKYAKAGSPPKYTIQEYIVGVPVYAHFFYSVVHKRLELLGFDRRYETNVDAIGRIPAKDQPDDITYTVIGNFPIVVRESLLPQIWDMGKNVVAHSRKIEAPGLWGPFCLELVITKDQTIICFEISARIVAGTNPYVSGSPYSDLLFSEPMSTGRRIAREIKEAQEKKMLKQILG